jgi:hypothetical protein
MFEETIIAQSDEFTIIQDDSEFVHFLDGENVIRLTMNRSTFDELMNQKYQGLVSTLKEIAQQKTCFERENDKNHYVEFLGNGRENDNFYPDYPEDVFDDGEDYGKITLARSILGKLDKNADDSQTGTTC